MAILERTSFSSDTFWRAGLKFCVLRSGDSVFTYILINARNALLLLVVTHVRYGMPHGENKENMAYSRCIFLNLQPNGMPRITGHAQNAMFVLTRWTNVYTHDNFMDFLPNDD